MKVVILAAGRGKRMGEHTQATTKAMLPIQTDNGNHKFATKPMLQITIERFIECGFNDFVIVVGDGDFGGGVEKPGERRTLR